MKKKFYIIAAVCFAVLITVSVAFRASSRITTAASYRDHVAEGDCSDWGQKTLTGEATSSVTTGCRVIESCVATIEANSAATQAMYVGCSYSTTNYNIVLGANNVGDTASGSIITSWHVDGYGTR